MSARAYTFSHAIVRAPSRSIAGGLRALDTGDPDLHLLKQHHDAYVATLASTGAAVTELEPLEAYPDSVFVEDTALCLAEGAIVLRPGVPTRLGEAAAIAPTLADFFGEVVAIEGPGCIEGGDILTTEREILVGRSSRTDASGVAELRRITGKWGYTVREVEAPAGVLHFKTDCSLLDEETILSTPRLAASQCFEGYRVIHTATGEEASANAIRFNALLMIPAGFPQTAEALSTAGYEVREIGNSEAAKLDGGMSCLSLRFSPLSN